MSLDCGSGAVACELIAHCVSCSHYINGERWPDYFILLTSWQKPNSNCFAAIRAHCVYPCVCKNVVPHCPPGVPVIRDGCGCCWQCARQESEVCNGAALCDASKGLTCRYEQTVDATGICHRMVDMRCEINNKSYADGEVFLLDCRTQCSCQNGTYACVSLCPGESIPPSDQCHHPHLVTIEGQCCREWMCDTSPDKSVSQPICEPSSGRWSSCSSPACGAGLSVRWATGNSNCSPVNQTRLCQVRPCQLPKPQAQHRSSLETVMEVNTHYNRHHHRRRGHQCKATVRHIGTVRLRVGACVSERRYKPKACGNCHNTCCYIHTSTTIKVPFVCPLHANTDLQQLAEAAVESQRWSRTATPPPPRVPSVYDMMDEGQPILDPVITDFSPPAYHRYEQSNTDSYVVDKEYLINNGENLFIEDDAEYERIRSDNYEVVEHEVEWILRCKCDSFCPPSRENNERPYTVPSTGTRHRNTISLPLNFENVHPEGGYC
ncbi:unnamed protein product, partial [Meganyctiphanes norvegica]